MKIINFIFSSFIINFLFFYSCSISQTPDNIKNILQKSCDSCHSWKNYKNIKTKDRLKWQEILQKMVIKGAKLDEKDFQKLLNYFSNYDK